MSTKHLLALFLVAMAGLAEAQKEQSLGLFASCDPQVRAAAVRALAELPADMKWHDALLKSLTDKSPNVRLAALKTFTKVGPAYRDLVSANARDIYSSRWNPGIIDLLRPTESDSEAIRMEAIKCLIKVWDSASTLFKLRIRCAMDYRLTLRYRVSQCLEELSERYPENFMWLAWDDDLDYVYGAFSHYPGNLWEDQGRRIDWFLKSGDKRRVALGVLVAYQAPPEVAFELLTPLQDRRKDENLALVTTLFLGTKGEALAEMARGCGGATLDRRLKAVRYLDSESVLKELLNDPEPRIVEAVRKRLEGKT